MKKLIFCLFFLSITLHSIGQTESTTETYELEGNMTSDSKLIKQHRTTLLKLNNPNRFTETNLLLGLTLQQAIETGDLKIYTDKECNKVIPKNKIPEILTTPSIDTIITFDPKTYFEEVKIVTTNQPNFPTENTTYDLTQNWNFNSKKQQLNTVIDMIQVNQSTTDGKNMGLFSLKNGKNPTIKNAKEINNPSIILAQQIDYTFSFESESLRKALLTNKHLKANKIINAFDRKTPFPKKDLSAILNGETLRDTVITFDPNTFEEEVKVIEYVETFDSKNITSFRVAQAFYFDAATNTIKSKVLAIAPMKKYYDKKGNFQYELLMFWIVYDDDFLEK